MMFFERHAGKGFELVLRCCLENLAWVSAKFV